MEYLILFAALFVCAVLVFGKRILDQKKREAWLAAKWKEDFGQVPQEEEAPERKGAIPGYFRRHREGFFIDDVTYNDLELDRIFSRMDTAKSSAGQEYLYYLLRIPSFSEEELSWREEAIRYFSREEETRTQMQFLFWKLGKTRKYSIYDYLDYLDNLGERSNWKHFGAWALLAAATGVMFLQPAWGLLALVCAIGFNISLYMREKRAIEPYQICFKYVFRAIEAAGKLCDLPPMKQEPLFEADRKRLEELLGRFSGLKKSGRFGMHVMGDGGNPLEMVSDYCNMILHLDLIGFNVMLRQLRSHSQDIDQLLGTLGKIDAMIAVSSYRASLPLWCVPSLKGADQSAVRAGAESEDGFGENLNAAALEMRRMYHPLIEDAVKNDICAGRGVLVTGSNASGKSTFLKAAAINAIFAQTIHTCAAASYCGCFCRVMSSMALRDDLESSESYYIVEIKSLKRILDSAGQAGVPVLCFVDEVLRGTNTVERIAASTQILKSLCGGNVLCFAATHDIELTELLEECYDNYHFQEQVERGDIFFPYELLPGRAQTRNAIRLLAVMGYDEEIIREADGLAARFLESGSWK